MPNVRSLGYRAESSGLSDGSASFAVLVSVVIGRLTSWLETGTVASVEDGVEDVIMPDIEGDIADVEGGIGDVAAELFVFVDDPLSGSLGHVRSATFVIVVDG